MEPSDYEKMWLCPYPHGTERHLTLAQYLWERHMIMEIGVPRHAISDCIQCKTCGRYPEPHIITRTFIEESHEWDLRSTEGLLEGQ